MIKKIIAVAALALACASGLPAQDKPSIQFKPYGFVRNYLVIDSRESVYGTEDFFYYVPKDRNLVGGTDLNQQTTVSFGAITSRLGLDVVGYQVNGLSISAKIEADFYAGVSGVTGTALLRLRQAFLSLSKDSFSLKVGQAWHPMAADMPHIFSLNTGAPFGPFSRTPEVVADFKLGSGFTLTAAAIWQMQYTSAGPSGASADYIKYGGIPELYLGLSLKQGGFTGRVGVDMLSIKPRHLDATGTRKVSDRITTFSPFLYAEYTKDLFSVKAKTIFAQAGEHMNLNGGYGVSGIDADGSWRYSPTRNSSTWISLTYGKKVQGVLFAGYVRNFGTKDALVGDLYFSKNSFSNMNRMFRVTPEIMFNWGKLTLGLEYEMTGVQYGSFGQHDNYGLATEGLHWVVNHRFQAMLRYTF
ncbi:MAG: VCBS domain-containing protein [Bacteroidales bacterium]|nr:VCBS domain-containing protein [Bacteroidales bacterium]